MVIFQCGACSASLRLAAPTQSDQSFRVTCPSCGTKSIVKISEDTSSGSSKRSVAIESGTANSHSSIHPSQLSERQAQAKLLRAWPGEKSNPSQLSPPFHPSSPSQPSYMPNSTIALLVIGIGVAGLLGTLAFAFLLHSYISSPQNIETIVAGLQNPQPHNPSSVSASSKNAGSPDVTTSAVIAPAVSNEIQRELIEFKSALDRHFALGHYDMATLAEDVNSMEAILVKICSLDKHSPSKQVELHESWKLLLDSVVQKIGSNVPVFTANSLVRADPITLGLGLIRSMALYAKDELPHYTLTSTYSTKPKDFREFATLMSNVVPSAIRDSYRKKSQVEEQVRVWNEAQRTMERAYLRAINLNFSPPADISRFERRSVSNFIAELACGGSSLLQKEYRNEKLLQIFRTLQCWELYRNNVVKNGDSNDYEYIGERRNASTEGSTSLPQKSRAETANPKMEKSTWMILFRNADSEADNSGRSGSTLFQKRFEGFRKAVQPKLRTVEGVVNQPRTNGLNVHSSDSIVSNSLSPFSSEVSCERFFANLQFVEGVVPIQNLMAGSILWMDEEIRLIEIDISSF